MKSNRLCNIHGESKVWRILPVKSLMNDDGKNETQDTFIGNKRQLFNHN